MCGLKHQKEKRSIDHFAGTGRFGQGDGRIASSQPAHELVALAPAAGRPRGREELLAETATTRSCAGWSPRRRPSCAS